jgi:hypothetical protein
MMFHLAGGAGIDAFPAAVDRDYEPDGAGKGNPDADDRRDAEDVMNGHMVIPDDVANEFVHENPPFDCVPRNLPGAVLYNSFRISAGAVKD